MNMFIDIINFISETVFELIKFTNFSNINLTKMLELDAMIIAYDIGYKMLNNTVNKKVKNTKDDKIENKEYVNKTKDKYNKSDIVNRYYNIYKLTWISRVSFYIWIYCISRIFYSLLNSFIINILLLFFVIPKFQNYIIINFLDRNLNIFKENCIKEIFIYTKFLLAKNFIRYLRSNIGIRIKNADIISVMVILNKNILLNILKNMVFLSGLMILREFDNGYYYYKGIKLSYYYQTGYLINKMDKIEATNYLKDLLKDDKNINKRNWGFIEEIKFLTPVFNIIYYTIYENIHEIKYNLIKFIIIWSWFNWILNRNILELGILLISGNKILLKPIVFYITSFTNYTNNFIYYLISFYICLIIVMYNNILLNDTFFYIKNYRSIKIMLLKENSIKK